MESWIRETSLYQEWEKEAELRGEKRAQLAIAERLLIQGVALETIALATKLSIEQLQTLQHDSLS